MDEFVLLIHPLVLGTETRLFEESPAIPFELVDTKTTPAGVVIATYRSPRGGDR